jgi:hypothetical protein
MLESLHERDLSEVQELKLRTFSRYTSKQSALDIFST